MIIFDDVIKEKLKEHNPNWPEFPDHSYRILIINSIKPRLLKGVKSWGGGGGTKTTPSDCQNALKFGLCNIWDISFCLKLL